MIEFANSVRDIKDKNENTPLKADKNVFLFNKEDLKDGTFIPKKS